MDPTPSLDVVELARSLLDDAAEPVDRAILATADRDALSGALRAAVAGLAPAEQRVRLAAAFQRLSAAERA